MSWASRPGLPILAAAALAAALIRAALLPFPGSTDVPYFRVWARYAATEGVGALYGTGGHYPERRVLDDRGVRTKVDYPPVALYELGVAARAADAAAGGQAGDRALTVAIKAIIVAAEAALVLLLFAGVSRLSASDAGTRAALRLWLDPSAILIGSVLGYLEPLYLLPAVAALLAAARGRASLAGALFAVALLTKPLAVFFAPAIAAGVWQASGDGRQRAAWSALSWALLTGLAAVAPVAVQGGLLNMAWGVGSVLRDPFLTGNAANVWWLAAALAAPHIELWRIVGGAATLAAMGWAFARMRSAPDASFLAAGAALAVHAYAVLAVSVHENHLFGAVPPLVLASAGRPRFRGVLLLVSSVCAVNLVLTAGLDALAAPALQMTAGALTACANCLGLAWHAAVFDAESRAAAPGQRALGS